MTFARIFAAIICVGTAVDLPAAAPAETVRLELSPLGEGEVVAIRSRDARQQLTVTAVQNDGSLSDVTREVTWSVSDPNVLAIDTTGLVMPTADGEITVTAALGDKTAATRVTVSGFAQPLPVNFRNQVVPIFTKLGCNGGGCHGKSGGQNGFKLSLLGFVPEDDFEFLRDRKSVV